VIQFRNISHNLAQAAAGQLLRQLLLLSIQLVLEPHPVFDQSSAGSLQLSENRTVFGDRRIWLQRMRCAYLCQNTGVSSVRLSQLPLSLRKAAGVLWVHLDQWQVVSQCRLERAVVRTFWFTNYAGWQVRPDPAAQLLEAGLCVGNFSKAPSLNRWQSRLSLEMSTPRLSSVIFVMSYACHSGRQSRVSPFGRLAMQAVCRAEHQAS